MLHFGFSSNSGKFLVAGSLGKLLSLNFSLPAAIHLLTLQGSKDDNKII